MPKDRMLQFFAYEHLPPHLQGVSKPFGDLASTIVETLPSNAERTVALRKLLEAKDCAESRPSSVTSLHPYGAALVSTNSAVPSFVRE
jgi:hypothetical protein